MFFGSCVLFELYTGGHRLYKMDHFVTGVLPEILAMQHLLEIETVMRSRSKPNEPVFPDEMRLRASKEYVYCAVLDENYFSVSYFI